MRKRMFLPIVLSLCMVQFGAFAATARGNSRGANNDASTASVAPARSAVRSAKMTTSAPAVATKKQTESLSSVGRAATKPTVAARAGTTQKVINNGTKVATATSNTVISQECQDAFYGCMDSFCMIDNASGGRCQCSDRNDELLKVMDDIAKLDEQSYIMATEGVERIQMGADAEQIIANAKAAGDKATGKATAEENKKKARTLDLSLWNSSVFDEDENFIDESIFSSSDLSNAMSKKGVALYDSAAKMCVGQMPSQCSGSLNMLQSVYAQKIKSDCTAFENSLKQQKIASTQKLQAAEKALRDAALEKFREENKYSTTGECVSAYAQCMETECGTDYSKCITFSAEENIKTANGLTKTNEKGRTIKGVVDIVLSGSTMNQIMSKKTICDGEVLKYCVNHQSEVWDKYLAYAATSLKSAEVNAEDNLRQNCIKDLSTCFKNACAAQFNPNKEEASYDMCLSDPYLVVDFCKVKLDACVVATGGKSATKEGVKGSRLWAGVTSMLAADRVDACTKEVKDGIKEICGEDFAHCVGLNPYSIANLMPFDKLTACKKDNTRNDEEMMDYIVDIAQGYALQINDALYSRCENAAKEAMIKVCGSSDTCDTLNLGNMSFDSLLKVELCVEKDDGTITCKNSVNDFDQKDIILGRVAPHIRNRVNVNSIVYNSNRDNEVCTSLDTFNNMKPADKLACYKGFSYDLLQSANPDGSYNESTALYIANKTDLADPDSTEVQAILKGLNNTFNTKMKVMLTDKTVYECMNGKNVSGFNEDNESASSVTKGRTRKVAGRISNATKDTNQDTIYENLMDSYQQVLISKSLELLREKYDEAEKALNPQIDSAYAKISERLKNIEGIKMDEQHKINEKACDVKATLRNTIDGYTSLGDSNMFRQGCSKHARRHPHFFTTASYDRGTGVCTVTRTRHDCTVNSAGCCWGWDQAGVPTVTTYKMPTINTEDLINDAKKSDDVKREDYTEE